MSWPLSEGIRSLGQGLKWFMTSPSGHISHLIEHDALWTYQDKTRRQQILAGCKTAVARRVINGNLTYDEQNALCGIWKYAYENAGGVSVRLNSESIKTRLVVALTRDQLETVVTAADTLAEQPEMAELLSVAGQGCGPRDSQRGDQRQHRLVALALLWIYLSFTAGAATVAAQPDGGISRWERHVELAHLMAEGTLLALAIGQNT